jgi:flagellar protein FliJ
MAVFRFRLQALLSLREFNRDQRRVELAEALDVQRQLAEQRLEVQRKIASIRNQVRAATGPGRVSLDTLRDAGRYESGLRAELAAVIPQELAAEQCVAERQQVLAEAEGEVRVLEKLRARQLENFTREQDRRDVKQMDEVAARGERTGGFD